MGEKIKIDYFEKIKFDFLCVGERWFFSAYCSKGLITVCYVNEKAHRSIAEFCDIPFEYYKKLMEEEDNPSLLISNVLYWLNNESNLRCLESIEIIQNPLCMDSTVIFNLKDKI